MSTNVREHLPILKYIAKTPSRRRRMLIKQCATNNFARCISECCWNVINGRVPLSDSEKRKLCKYKKTLRELANRRVSLTSKKRTLQSGGFLPLLPLLIGPVIKTLGGLLRK